MHESEISPEGNGIRMLTMCRMFLSVYLCVCVCDRDDYVSVCVCTDLFIRNV